MATKRVKLLKPWTMFTAGAEVEFQTSIADLLILRGRAEEIKEAPVVAMAPKVALKKKFKKGRGNRGN